MKLGFSGLKFLQRSRTALIGLVIGGVLISVAALNAKTPDNGFQQNARVPDGAQSINLTISDGRDVELFLPQGYSENSNVPLLIDLHGYTGSSKSQAAYTFLQEAAYDRGLAYVAPDGLEDSLGSQYWNATTACCDFNRSGVDDVAFIESLIEKIKGSANIDSSRIYLFGHSNGHFMGYALLCSGTDEITAVAGLAGAMDPNIATCRAKPSNILHIHGEADGTILFDGGALFGNRYTSAVETVKRWSYINSCGNPKQGSIDAIGGIEGEEIRTESYSCERGALEFWIIKEGIHTPTLDISFADRVIDWLMKHKALYPRGN
jgi:polyhydroxybutyrate depolymerase